MPDVSVQFLGSGDAFGSGGRLQTCISVEAGDTRYLLGCTAVSVKPISLATGGGESSP